MRLFWEIYEKFFYYMSGKACWLWHKFAGDKASYWLDFLPAFCSRERYRGQNKRMKLELKKSRGVNNVFRRK